MLDLVLGETLEQAVHREVREEVGVELDDLRYAASQPWPFPHSLMVGFEATWLAGHEPVGALTVWVRLDRPSAQPGTVAYASADGLTAGADAARD